MNAASPALTPPFVAPQSFTDADAALQQVQRIYRQAQEHLRTQFRQFDGTRAGLPHHDARCDIGDTRGDEPIHPFCYAGGRYGNNRITGTGNVGHFTRLSRNFNGGFGTRQQGHPLFTAG